MPSARPGLDPVEAVLAYHQATKHHPHRYARSLGYMDWDTQPDPFRRYAGARLFHLDEVALVPGPTYDELFSPGRVPEAQLNRHFVSQLFYDSLALSSWKEFGDARWSLRVNPSSGNLHPTEGYLVCGPVSGLHDRPAIYHYAPYLHALELRAELSMSDWEELVGDLPRGSLFVGLTSIHWREAWKYGERAFRYCHHDVGHAVGAVAIAAGVLGWDARLLESVDTSGLGRLLGVSTQIGIEAEHPDCLMVLTPRSEPRSRTELRSFRLPNGLLERLEDTPLVGEPNRLSRDHHQWPVIDGVSDLTERPKPPADEFWHPGDAGPEEPAPAADAPPARQVIRQRRSAVAMDGRTGISLEAFVQMMRRVLPGATRLPFGALPWRPRVHLVVFVHRVQDLEAGLYLLVREPSQVERLRAALSPRFTWERPAGLARQLPLWRLEPGDWRRQAQMASCGQDIAADGCFALAMLGELRPSLEEIGPWFYPRLFWETGAIGQVLYLEAEAAGIRSTGIGCFFDDVVHERLGLTDATFQALYHFTVGGPVEDTRLRASPAYAHLRDDRREA